MVIVEVSLQPLGAVPITVYCVVVEGVAKTEAAVEEFNVAAGDHKNVVPAVVAVAVNDVFSPLQILLSVVVTLTVSATLMVTLTPIVVSLLLFEMMTIQ